MLPVVRLDAFNVDIAEPSPIIFVIRPNPVTSRLYCGLVLLIPTLLLTYKTVFVDCINCAIG